VVVAVELQDDKRVVVLDQTICHPQGGAHPKGGRILDRGPTAELHRIEKSDHCRDRG
jgi:hypothetical protein